MSTQKPFVQESSNVFMQNKLLVVLVAVIALSSVYDSFQISSMRDNHETIIMPYGDAEPYRLRHNSANLPYIKDMAQYIIYLYTNHSSLTVNERYNTLLSFFHESSLPRYRAHLNKMSTDYAKYVNISHVGQVNLNNGITLLNNRLTIMYTQSQITGMTVQLPKHKQIFIDYMIQNGRFWILEMGEIKAPSETKDK
jgi:hypothetical protein